MSIPFSHPTEDCTIHHEADEYGLITEMDAALHGVAMILSALSELLINHDFENLDSKIARRLGAAYQVASCAEELATKAEAKLQPLHDLYFARKTSAGVQS